MFATHIHPHPVRVSTGLLAGALVQTACGGATPPSREACEGPGPAPEPPELSAPREPIITSLDEPKPNVAPLAADAIIIHEAAPEPAPHRSGPARRAAATPAAATAPAPEPTPPVEATPESEPETEPAPEPAPAPKRADPVARSYVDTVGRGIWTY